MRYDFDEKGGGSRIRAAALAGFLAMAFNVEAAPPASPGVDAVKAELEALKREVEVCWFSYSPTVGSSGELRV